jgi:hypothetical protein
VLVGPGGLCELNADMDVAGMGDVPLDTEAPVEYSEGTRPQKPMNAPEWAKRSRSQTPQTMVSSQMVDTLTREGGLARSILEVPCRDPRLVAGCPSRPVPEDLVVAKKERAEALASTMALRGCDLTGPAQVAHSLLGPCRDPDRGELTCAMQARQAPAVPAAGFHLVARGLLA